MRGLFADVLEAGIYEFGGQKNLSLLFDHSSTNIGPTNGFKSFPHFKGLEGNYLPFQLPEEDLPKFLRWGELRKFPNYWV